MSTVFLIVFFGGIIVLSLPLYCPFCFLLLPFLLLMGSDTALSWMQIAEERDFRRGSE